MTFTWLTQDVKERLKYQLNRRRDRLQNLTQFKESGQITVAQFEELENLPYRIDHIMRILIGLSRHCQDTIEITTAEIAEFELT